MLLCPWKAPYSLSNEELLNIYKESVKVFEKTDLLDGYANHKKSWDIWDETHKCIYDAILEFDNLLSFKAKQEISSNIYGGGGEVFLERAETLRGRGYLNDMLQVYREDLVGTPPDLVGYQGAYITKTSMRHFYHALFIKHHVPLVIHDMDYTLIEIGGGFGNLCRIVNDFHLSNRYIIVDLPVMLFLQYYYLRCHFSEQDIALIDRNGEYVSGNENSRILLVNTNISSRINEYVIGKKCLVSTVALTEIAADTQQQYLSEMQPDLIYLYGQKNNLSREAGMYTEDCLDNSELLQKLFHLYENLFYRDYGYYFEFFGRTHAH